MSNNCYIFAANINILSHFKNQTHDEKDLYDNDCSIVAAGIRLHHA